MKSYRIANRDEQTCCYEYDQLIGPHGFECTLTEPEDRTWYRDLSEVVDELNKMYGIIKEAGLLERLQ